MGTFKIYVVYAVHLLRMECGHIFHMIVNKVVVIMNGELLSVMIFFLVIV